MQEDDHEETKEVFCLPRKCNNMRTSPPRKKMRQSMSLSPNKRLFTAEARRRRRRAALHVHFHMPSQQTAAGVLRMPIPLQQRRELMKQMRHKKHGEQREQRICLIGAFSSPSRVSLKIPTTSSTTSSDTSSSYSSSSGSFGCETRFFEVDALRSCMMEQKMFRSIFKKHKHTSIVSLPAASIGDLKDAVITVQKKDNIKSKADNNNNVIIHLSGHCGRIRGIVYDDAENEDCEGGGYSWLFHSDTDLQKGVLVSAKRVADTVSRSKGTICLVLSACDTIHFAKEIVRELSLEKYRFDIRGLAVICTTTRLEDEFALKFTSAFYSRLLVNFKNAVGRNNSSIKKCELIMNTFEEAKGETDSYFGNPDLDPTKKKYGGIFIAERASNLCKN